MSVSTGCADGSVTVLFILASFRSSVGLLCILVFTALTFLALGINSATGSDGARIAGGVFGMIATTVGGWRSYVDSRRLTGRPWQDIGRQTPRSGGLKCHLEISAARISSRQHQYQKKLGP